MERYQVGQLTWLKDEDPVFDTIEQARAHAVKQSETVGQPIMGIWTDQDSGSELLEIVYEGESFAK